MVQKPSDSSVSDLSGPHTIDKVLASERLASSQQSLPKAGELTTVPPNPASEWQVPEVPASGMQVPVVSVPALAKTPQIRRRTKVMRKTRNVAARKTILKILLGRQLAGPTKQALSMLAKGENVDLENLAVPVLS